MAVVAISDSILTDIADAIRSKNGTENTYKPAQMPDAIEAISGGITPTGTKQISITQNGTTTEDVTNYAGAEITVNVPTGSTPVINSLSVTENGTYTAPSGVDGYSPITVNVSGGGSLPPKILGSYYQDANIIIETYGNHVKITALKYYTGLAYNLRQLGIVLNNQTWFNIPANAAVDIVYKNVVNADSIEWNANFKAAGTTTSMSYGIGNGTHLGGATISKTATASEDVGCLFIYIASFTTGNVLEFDVELTINNTRYI